MSSNPWNYQRTLKRDHFQNIEKRVEQHLADFQANIGPRRERLQDLLWREERNDIRQTVERAVNGQDDNLLNMKIRTEQLRSKREAERLKIVKEKKLQQYLERCEEFRPVLANRRLRETKEAQLAQISEKKSQIESEKAIDYMWYKMLMREIDAKNDRDQQEKFLIRKKKWEQKSIWDMQCKARELQRADVVREVHADAIRLDNLKEQLRREEIASLDAKRRKRDQIYSDTMGQIRERQESLARQAELEMSLAKSQVRLQEAEIAKEKKLDQKDLLRREMNQYMDFKARLDQERKDEEQRLNMLVKEEYLDIQAQQDSARCMYERAQNDLEQSCIQGRQKQMQVRRQEAEQKLKMKQAEIKIFQLAFEHNERMQAEYVRGKMLASKQYESDLKQQVEFGKLLKEREKALIEQRIQQSKAEEEEYKDLLATLMQTNVKFSETHPFTKVLSKENSPFPKPCTKSSFFL